MSRTLPRSTADDVALTLTAGLVALGVPNAVAMSTAIAYRLVTFYLPPIWGSLATRWLKQHQYL